MRRRASSRRRIFRSLPGSGRERETPPPAHHSRPAARHPRHLPRIRDFRSCRGHGASLAARSLPARPRFRALGAARRASRPTPALRCADRRTDPRLSRPRRSAVAVCRGRFVRDGGRPGDCRARRHAGRTESFAAQFCSRVSVKRSFGHSSIVVRKSQALRARNTGTPSWSSALADGLRVRKRAISAGSSASSQRAS